MSGSRAQRHRRLRLRRPRPSRGLLLLPVVGIVLGTAVLGVSPAVGGFTASIGNGGDSGAGSSSAGTGSLQLSAASGGTTECSTSTGSSTASCSGTLAPASVTSSAQSLSTSLSETGSITASSTTLTEASCAPIALSNATASSDPLLIRAGVTTGATTSSPAPSGSTGVTFDGSTGNASEVVTETMPSVFSEAVWFKASVGGGTKGGIVLAQTANAGVNTPGTPNDIIWIDNAGKVVFGLLTGSKGATGSQVTSSSAYNNGAWHLAVATYSGSAQTLYVDGSQVATTSVSTGFTTSGTFIHLGWGAIPSTFTDAPSSVYFPGSETDAAIFSTALTASQISSLYGAASQATWASTVAGDSPTASWSLGDPATNTYTGTAGWYSPNAGPCTFVDTTIAATLNGATTCLSPASSASCAAPSSSSTLYTLRGNTLTVPSPTPSQPVTLTVTTAKDSSYGTGPNYGLHLQLVFNVAASSGSFTATLTWPAQNLPLT